MARSPIRPRARPTLDELETRAVPATIRIVTYNIEADIDGVTTPRAGLYQVLEGIGEEEVQGDVQPPDIITLEETTSNSTTVAPIVTNLNSYYNGLAVYAQSPYQATESDNDPSDGNGPNALVYNTSTLNLLASVGVGTPEGSTNGEYRQVVRYEFQPVGYTGSTGIFYVYDSHMKSGSTSGDATDRGEEATIIRDNEATLPASASVLYTGDLNSAPPEAEFTEFTSSGQGEAYDPVNFSTSVQYYSESDTDLRYRDDYELMTSNVLNDAGGINYVSGSFHVFGNNGTTPVDGSVDSGSDTALNSDLVQDGPTFISASTLYADLTTASDHLPAVADYTIAQIPTSTTLTDNGPNPSPSSSVGVSLKVVVTPTAPGSPSGLKGEKVYIEDASTKSATVASATLNHTGSKTASATITWTPKNSGAFVYGANELIAVFHSAGGYGASQSSQVKQTILDPTSISLADNGPNPSTPSQNVGLTVTVTPQNGVSPSTLKNQHVAIYDASDTKSGAAQAVATGALTKTGSGMANGTFNWNPQGSGIFVSGANELYATYAGDGVLFDPSGNSGQVKQTIETSATGTTTSMKLNGISPATAGLPIEIGYAPTVTVDVAPTKGTAAASGSVSIVDTSISGNPVVGTGQLSSSGQVTITLNTTGSGNLLQVGTNNLVANFQGSSNFASSSSSSQNQAINSLFELDTFTQTATGFTGTFDGVVNTSLLSDYTNSSSATPSVTLTNGSTAVPGSVVFDAADTQLTFVATNPLSGSTLLSGILAPGATYTPLLSGVASNTQSFQDTIGDAFAGNGSSAGTNYNTNFTSSNTSTATTVWVPYVARGYSQPVNVPASSSSGLPIYITIPSGGSALTSATFTFNYNPALLNVTAAAVDSSISSNFTGSFTINQAAGTVAVTLTANSGKNLAAGATYTVADLTATVQTTATYKDKEVLNLTNININGGTNNGQDGSQVHVAAFVDNANAVTQSSSEPTTIPSAYSGQDAFDMLSVAGSSSSTILHNVYKMLDPTVLGDDANSGHATAQAAHDTLVVAGGGTVANIPELPNVITAATESSTTVTITTFEALPLTVGEKVTVAGVNVNGYNGSNLTVTGVSGNTFTYTDSTSGLGNSSGGDVSIPNPVGGPDPTIYLSPTLATTAGGTVTLTVYLLVNNSGGLLYDSDDVAIRFDASRFTASNLSAPSSGDPDFQGGNALVGSGSINNSTGTITFSEFTDNGNGVQLANGSSNAIATITFNVDSNAPVGVASIHLAQQIGTHATDVNGGNATLNPAPNDGALSLSGDPSGIPYQAGTDDKFSIVPQSGAIAIPAPTKGSNDPLVGKLIVLFPTSSFNNMFCEVAPVQPRMNSNQVTVLTYFIDEMTPTSQMVNKETSLCEEIENFFTNISLPETADWNEI